MTFIIVGASAGLGRSLAEKFASEKNDLILISSDIRDLVPLKSDLEIRFRVKIIPIEMSLNKISEYMAQFVSLLQSVFQNKNITTIGMILTVLLLISGYYLLESHKEFKNKLKNLS